MKNHYLVVLCALLVVAGTIPSATQTIRTTSSYVVDLPERRLSNGLIQPPRRFVVERPAPGTIVPGAIIVRTKQSHGALKGDRVLGTSLANVDLAAVNVRDISMTASASATTLRSLDARITGLDRTYTVRFEEGHDEFELCRTLMNNPDVDFAIPVYIHKLFYTPNDPQFASQGFLNVIRAPQAWDITKGSADVVVAIIDSGTDWQHEDLAESIWINTKEVPNNGIDDDNNGYIDDIRGWDFVGNVTQQQAMQQAFRPDNDPRVSGTNLDGVRAHGTTVAGNAIARTNNGKGIAGVGHDCKILAVKCGSDVGGVSGIYRGYEGIIYAADMGADIINCSWGGPGADPAAQSVIDYALSKGSMVIAAAGNDGQPFENYPQAPATLSGVMSVGSSSNNDRVSSFTNHGWQNVLYAPGENPLSTYPGNQYRGQTGTSFSSPVASGVAALVKSLHPDWTPFQIMMQMRMTVDGLQGVSASERGRYFGRVNAEKAVKFNRSFTSGDRVPGLYYQSHTIVSGQQTITTLEPADLTVTIANALADAPTATVNIAVLDNNVELMSESSVSMSNVTQAASKTFPMRIRLLPTYPWYQASILVRLTILSGTSVNIAHFEVPTQRTTTNSYSGSSLPADWLATFTHVDFSTSSNVLWAAARSNQGPIGLVGSQSGGGSLIIYPYNITALEAMASDRAIVGGITQGRATTSRTVPGQSNWANTDVSSFLTSVDGIHSYDNTNIVVVGTGVGGRLGCGRSNNGGQTWQSVSSTPTLTTSDVIVNKGVAFLGDRIWAVSASGRVCRSSNRGQSWSVSNLNVSGSVVLSMAFRDSVNGVILYRTGSGASTAYRIASSSNSGASWQANVFDVSTLRITPVTVSSPGGHHVIIGSRGEVYGSDDNGSSWQPILSKPAGTVSTALAVIAEGESAVLLGGTEFGVLSYRYSGPNGTRILSAPTEEIDFGVMNIGQNRQRFVRFENLGTSDVSVTSVAFLDENNQPVPHFEVSATLGPVIGVGTSDQLGVRFRAPSTPGTYRATAVVIVDGTPSEFRIPLVAKVDDPSSVIDLTQTARLAPNPVTDVLVITFADSRSRDIHIIDGTGRRLLTMTSESQTVRLATSDLAPGHYTVLVRDGSSTASARIVVVR